MGTPRSTRTWRCRCAGRIASSSSAAAARPRRERPDRAHPDPDPDSLAAPIGSLTPADWEERLEGIAERGLVVPGIVPGGVAGGPWRVIEPAFPYGPTFAAALAE